MYRLLIGDNLDILSQLISEGVQVDSVVTDPPYGLSFMNRKWDYDVPSVAFWKLVYQVLKPGGHVLSFGGTRTYHRMVVNLEDAGFEIRDQLAWIYGSGFPKSMDISKAIDKAAGADREVVGMKRSGNRASRGGAELVGAETSEEEKHQDVTAPATDEAKQWEGWGTALKPAQEPVVLARKPLDEDTVAANVLKHGTGGLNIDGCRIGTHSSENFKRPANHTGENTGWDRPWKHTSEGIENRQIAKDQAANKAEQLGRFPANVLLDEEAAEQLDLMTGELKAGFHVGRNRNPEEIGNRIYGGRNKDDRDIGYNDTGGASRFFKVFQFQKPNHMVHGEQASNRFIYCAKASQKQRLGSKHPTVKPIDLMRYLVRLITPPGGTIFDPYAGSGTTGQAAELEGFDSILIEREESYAEDIRRRMESIQKSAPNLEGMFK